MTADRMSVPRGQTSRNSPSTVARVTPLSMASSATRTCGGSGLSLSAPATVSASARSTHCRGVLRARRAISQRCSRRRSTSTVRDGRAPSKVRNSGSRDFTPVATRRQVTGNTGRWIDAARAIDCATTRPPVRMPTINDGVKSEFDLSHQVGARIVECSLAQRHERRPQPVGPAPIRWTRLHILRYGVHYWNPV